MVLHVRGTVLPEREERSLWIDGGVLREDPVPDAETVADGGWLLPGLVDVHTHPGAVQPGDPFDESVLRTDLAEHAATGVLLVRAPGSAARIPGWAHDAEGLPRVRSAGPWLATPGRFFPSWGRHVTEAELAGAAVEEAAAAQQAAATQQAASMPEAAGPAGRGSGSGLGTGQAAASAPGPAPAAAGGWCKIIGDWAWDEPPVPLAVLRDVTSAVHAIGGKVSVHCQTAAGCANAVAAGVDSLEHGMHLDPGLLHQMAAQGTALVPTLNAFAASAFRVRAWDPGARRDSFLAGWAAMPPAARAAYEAGVTVLAGTDTHPCGTVAEEVERLISAGLPRADAVGAASWGARAWLGLPGLVDGAPADLVIFDEDPVAHPDVLHHPRRIILRGQILA
jgi:imidazolonepropionase-like amidohydrolase